jgi:hypothetical protein
MSKLKSTILLCFGLCFSAPLFLNVVQPNSALSQQTYNRAALYTNDHHLWFPEVYIDSRFSKAEVERLGWGITYFAALTSPGNTSFQSKYHGCLSKYYDSPWKRMSSEERAQDRYIRDRDARGELINGNIIPKLQRAFQMQVDGRRRRLYIDLDTSPRQPNGLITTAYVQGLGAANRSEDLHIYVNQTWLATRIMNSDRAMFEVAGTSLHEFIHLVGYDHPTKIEPNFSNVEHNIVYESGWCMLRNMEDKPPGSIMLTDDNSVLFVD